MRDPDALRSRAGIMGDPDQDQHFLVDDRVLDRLPTYLPETVSPECILEVGAGTGALTDRLLGVTDRVIAVERDRRLAEFLREEFAEAIANEEMTVIEGDVLEVDLPAFDASVSNLPYGACSEILFTLLPAGVPLVVTVQKEFADRMVADPGTDDYGRLSVSVGHFAEAEIVETVPPTAFDPEPAVESAIVRTQPTDPVYEGDPDFFLGLIKAVFTQRRKTMRNAISNTTHISGITDAAPVLDALDEDLLSRRAGTVTPAEFARIADIASEHV